MAKCLFVVWLAFLLLSVRMSSFFLVFVGQLFCCCCCCLFRFLHHLPFLYLAALPFFTLVSLISRTGKWENGPKAAQVPSHPVRSVSPLQAVSTRAEAFSLWPLLSQHWGYVATSWGTLLAGVHSNTVIFFVQCLTSFFFKKQVLKLQGRAGTELALKLPVDIRNIYFLYLF